MVSVMVSEVHNLCLNLSTTKIGTSTYEIEPVYEDKLDSVPISYEISFVYSLSTRGKMVRRGFYFV